MSAWDFNDTYTEDAYEGSGTDNDDAFIDVDYGHKNLEKTCLMMIVDREDEKKIKQKKNGDEK